MSITNELEKKRTHVVVFIRTIIIAQVTIWRLQINSFFVMISQNKVIRVLHEEKYVLLKIFKKKLQFQILFLFAYDRCKWGYFRYTNVQKNFAFVYWSTGNDYIFVLKYYCTKISLFFFRRYIVNSSCKYW